jgi:hypothetical protein
VTTTGYFDSNYNPRGLVGTNYGVFLTPLAIPASVTVGGTNTLGSLTQYTDSTKSTADGRIDYSYVVEADTSTTATVNFIMKFYNSARTLTATAQTRYRITATDALTPTSIDIQYANGSTNHLVFIFN